MAYPLFHPRHVGDLPMIMTGGALRAALPGESGLVEFKQGVPEDKIREAVVAFSNTDGGVLLIGVGPDGVLHDRPLTGEFEARIHRVMQGVQSPGRYDVHELQVDDRRLTVLSVERRQEGFAQMHDGRVLVRRGAMNAPLIGDHLTRFVAGRALTRFETTTTDLPLVSAPAALLAQLAAAYRWRDEDGHEDRLAEIGLIAPAPGGAVLTVAGVLCLSDDPAAVLGKAYVEIFRYRDGGTVYDKRSEIRGDLPRQITEATRAVLDELGSDVVVVGVHRHELPRIPETVLREALANAVAHRTYENARQSVRVEIHPDRVTVRSPGSLPEPVTVANIRDQNAARNVDVIKVLRTFRLAEDAGQGVDVMQDTMEAHLLDPPEFDTDGTSVTVTLRLGSTVTPRERAWVTEVEHRGGIRPGDRALLVHAARGELLTNTTVRELMGVDSMHARSALQRLRDAGLLEQSGSRGGVTYTLAEGLGAPAARLDPDAVRAIVLAMAADGPVTNENVRERTGLERQQALALLGSMVERGELVREGARRGTTYRAS